MPTYEYQCSACLKQIEVFQKISEAPLTECPSCGKNTLEKWVSPAGFQLKGTGWYVTDFKNKTPPKTSETTSTPEANPKTASETENKAPTSSQETKADSQKSHD